MKSEQIRNKFKKYFAKKLNHTWVVSSTLIPENDPSVLLTTAGMQQFKPYFLGEASVKKDFHNRNLCSIQRCFRTSDIDEVGDESHLTFFEMMGNFSLGGYFKDKAIEYAWKFLTKEVGADKKRLFATIFEGDDKVVKDFESYKIWEKYLSKEKISEFGRKYNWWGPPGKTGPCGPCTEIHFDLSGKPCSRGDKCQPNCQCGRYVEIWNLVFMEYFLDANGELKDLPTKNIDTGMGLERLAMVLQKKKSVFETDLFAPIMQRVDDKTIDGLGVANERNKRLRIVADHLRGSVFLLADGIKFSNKDQGYILRRIFRRMVDQFEVPDFDIYLMVKSVIDLYSGQYPHLKNSQDLIIDLMHEERTNYHKVLKVEIDEVFHRLKGSKSKKAEKEIKPSTRKITGQEAFRLYSTHGLTSSLIRKKGFDFNEEEFLAEVEKHKKVSRAGAEKKFGGVGEFGATVAPLHTATHLLHAALRSVLGEHVQQMGSDLNPDRLRFDFSHPDKLTDGQKKEVEKLVNQMIKDKLPVVQKQMPLEEAKKTDALAFFKEKYPEKVNVYAVGDFSKEICAGPHVKNTSELGRFKIVSEKSSARGTRRIKAILEK